MSNTSHFPKACINRGLDVETLAAVSEHPLGRHAVPLLALLVWIRERTGDDWLKVTNEIWRRRVGLRLKKYEAATALEDLGMVEVRREGKQALQFKLADRVDPKVCKAEFKKQVRKHKRRKPANTHVYPKADDAMVVDIATRQRKQGGKT